MQTYLDTTVSDTMDICLLDSINKWSKIKPVWVNTHKPLTPEQFKNSAPIGEGYLYGVQLRFMSMNIAEIHDSDFPYQRPVDYYRLTDLYGYDKDATADISHRLGFEVIYRDIGTTSQVHIDVDYSGTNTTGLPVKEVLKDSLNASGATDEEAFANVYPFILVGDYMCALAASKDTISGEYIIDPICTDGEWKDTFYCDFGKLHDTYGLELGEAQVSILLVGTYPNTPDMQTYLDGEWHNMGGMDTVVLSRPFFPCPPVTGRLIEVEDYYRYAKRAQANISGSNTRLIIVLTWPDGTPTETTYYKITAKVGRMGVPVTKTSMFLPSGMSIIEGFSWEEFGLVIMDGQEVTEIYVDVYTNLYGVDEADQSLWTTGVGVENGSVIAGMVDASQE